MSSGMIQVQHASAFGDFTHSVRMATMQVVTDGCGFQTTGQRAAAPTIPKYLQEAQRLLHQGFKLVRLHDYEKRPIGEGWNTPANFARTIDPQATGYGLPLSLNKLCSIDPDHIEFARRGLAACGWSLEDLMAAGVRTRSTRPNSGGRSTFLTDDRLSWVTFGVKVDGKSVTALELRADSDNLQDCVPGVLYLDKAGMRCTQEYAGGKRLDDADDLPAAFAEWWARLSSDGDYLHEQQRLFADACGAQSVLSLPTKAGATMPYSSPMRGSFNSTVKVETILDRHGYKWDGKTQRYSAPDATGGPGVRLVPGKDGLWRSSHGSDPLRGLFDAWVAYVVLEHAYDVKAAEMAAQGMGITGRASAVAVDSPWPEPVDLWSAPTTARLERGVMPEVIDQYAREVAEVGGFDFGGVVTAATVVCASVIDDRIKIGALPNDPSWQESARLWAILVGGPSSRKTPILQKVCAPLLGLVDDLDAEHGRAMGAYNAAMAEWKAIPKAERGEPPGEPVEVRLMTTDASNEKLGEILADNPRGILLRLNEAGSFIGGAGAYSSTAAGGMKAMNERLELYDGGRNDVDRIGRGHIVVPNWGASIIGGSQPDTLAGIFKRMPNNGFVERFIWSWVQSSEPVDRPTDMAVLERYATVVRRLYRMQPGGGSAMRAGALTPIPEVATYSAQAEEVRRATFKRIRQAVQSLEGSRPRLASHIGKFEGLFSRLVLAIHCIRIAAAGDDPFPTATKIDPTTAHAASDYLWEYVLPGDMAAHSEVIEDGRTEVGDLVEATAARILALGWDSLTPHRCSSGVRQWRYKSSNVVGDALNVLEQAGWIRCSAREPHGRGRRPEWAYQVNPQVHERFNRKARIIAQADSCFQGLLAGKGSK
jgi:hypothetical protein